MDEELSKLSKQATDAERHADNCYRQLGQLYIAIHGKEPEPAFRSLVEEAANAERFVMRCQLQMEDCQNTVACSSCGARISQTAMYCGKCGTPTIAETPDAAVAETECAACGGTILPGDRFCAACGRPVKPVPVESGIKAPNQELVAGESVKFADEAKQPEDGWESLPADLGFSTQTSEARRDLFTEDSTSAGVANQSNRVCPECGAGVSPRAVFCIHCGSRL